MSVVIYCYWGKFLMTLQWNKRYVLTFLSSNTPLLPQAPQPS